jgi:streptogramin lyase
MAHRAPVLCASLLLVTACGDSGGRGSDSASSTAPGTTLPTTLPATDPTTQPTGDGTDSGTTSAGSDSDSNSDSSPVTSGSSDPGTKFDQGTPTPDFGVPGCGDSGGEPDTMFSYIWIANSGQGTVSKINTKTGVEEGRYYVEGGSPSRTSVNLQGDVAVSARDPGGVTKIASIPERCVDTNGNGVIDTSTGPNDIRPKGSDECVLWFKPIPSPGYTYGPRATAWEGVKADPVTCEVPTPRLWFAWMDANSTAHFTRVDGATGATLDEVNYQWQGGDGFSPYGGAVNAAGDFFATGLNMGPAVKVDAVTLQVTDFGLAPGCKYGMSLDADGNIWNGGCIGGNMYVYDAQLQQWIDIGNAAGSRVNGVMADRDGNVWGAGSDPCRLVHVDAKTRTYINPSIPLPGCASPWGVSIDVDGYVWVVDMSANMAFKVDPDTYQTVLTVGGLINPYTYSDMTGAGLNLQVNPPG